MPSYIKRDIIVSMTENTYKFVGVVWTMRKNNKLQVIDFENTVQKSNEFSMAKLNQGLTLNQMQLFAFAIYCTQTDGKTEFHKADFEKKFGIEKYQTGQAKKDVPKLSQLQFSLVDLEAEIVDYLNVFQRIRYDKGLFVFRWSEDMIPHILDLKDLYLTTDLGIASQFKSGFSWTLYDYLKAHYGFWHKNLSKAALMNLFGISDVKSYQSNTGLLKKKVLDVAVAELNKYTELKVWYVEKKEGRSIVGFDIHWSTGEKVTAATDAQMQELKTILNAIEKDMFTYVDLRNDDNRKTALEVVRKAVDMQISIKDTLPTKERADFLLSEAKWCLKTLERLLELNNKKAPVFYNWLEEK